MTDKLKCPFCGAELKKEMAGDIETGRLVCCTKNCPVIDQNLFPDVWELLTTGKKAQDALKIVDGKLKVIANDENPSPIQSQALDCYIQIAKDCRDTITSITKQENE